MGQFPHYRFLDRRKEPKVVKVTSVKKDEPSQISKKKFLAKIVNGYAVNYFRKKLHLRCLTRF